MVYNLKKQKEPALRNAKGFTLLEVIVAIYIIIVGLSAALALVNKVLSSTSVSSSQIIASGLAQEGIEVVRNIRDLNWNSGGSGWNNWYANPPTGTWELQYNDQAFRANNNTIIKYNSATGLYSYDIGLPTLYSFRRSVAITHPSPDEIKVVVVITWNERGRSHTLNVEDHLWKWRPAI